MFKRAGPGEIQSPKPKVRKVDSAETQAKEVHGEDPAKELHGVKRAVQPPSRGEQSKIWRIVRDIYPPEYKTEENRVASGKQVISFKCQCLLPGCTEPQFWQRHIENRKVVDHLLHFHNISRKDIDDAPEDWINELLKMEKSREAAPQVKAFAGATRRWQAQAWVRAPQEVAEGLNFDVGKVWHLDFPSDATLPWLRDFLYQYSCGIMRPGAASGIVLLLIWQK